MADVKAGVNPLFLREEELRQGLDLLFRGGRTVTQATDALLAKRKLGRAHQRALFFIGRQRSISVGTLLDILGITKQSLGRVLAGLAKDGYITQCPGINDRRQRLLSLTEKGIILERELYEAQRPRLAAAYRSAGAEAVDGFSKVLEGLAGGKG